jgi:oxygen-independent coproporphyrinogen-3 oxidase
MEPLGLYLSIPFCRAKCTFCNFASDSFAADRMEGYVNRLCAEIAASRTHTEALGASLPKQVDTIYLGGGTPSLLRPPHVAAIFDTIREHFQILPAAEITVECAPGQLADDTLREWLRRGVNRVSLGVQSFIDAEAAAVGRLHTRALCETEIARLREAGLEDLSLDLIAGLPGQTLTSWRDSLRAATATEVPHVSIYMFELDEDSRLGQEALRGGSRYGAATLPSDEETAMFYELACESLAAAGIAQYEISNFARSGHESRHNLKYWRRQPYRGFGLDAHSMLRTALGAVRFANTDSLAQYLEEPGPLTQLRRAQPPPAWIRREEAFEESLFLGLRLQDGVALPALREQFGAAMVRETMPAIHEMADAGLLRLTADHIALTRRGQLLSNEVFERLLLPALA